MPRYEPNPFDVLGILPTIRLAPAEVQRAYAIALSWIRQCANLLYTDEQGKQYYMPYSETELAAARDFFLSPTNLDETDPTRFHPGMIDSILRNMSGHSVLHYYSSWNPSACHPMQVTLPIPGWPLHSIYAFHRWSPPLTRQKCHHKPNDLRRKALLTSPPQRRFMGSGTALDPIVLDPVINETRLAQPPFG